ncbi:Uncharacterised protein [Bordetella pertussis]|nr:Uncharacterised protein [Bordetella pertussis]CFW40657.1 Uncharacterised protein [Bordetella pertussis]
MSAIRCGLTASAPDVASRMVYPSGAALAT